MTPADDSLPPILPVGTQVVIVSTGAVGAISRAPVDLDHTYTVRLPDGQEVTAARPQIDVLSHWQRRGDRPAEADLRPFIIYQCVVGSRAFGLDDEHSDVDRRGIYLPPADLHWSLAGVPEQLDFPDTEECYWELGKFLSLALKANPNILECLWTPHVERATPLAEELRAMRRLFLSKLVYQTYNGYVLSQFKKLQSDLRNRGEVKWKHIMHLLRLLVSGINALREGEIRVDAGEHRDKLRAVKRGEIPLEELETWRLHLHQQFDAAAATTSLPDRPDYEAANNFLLRARRSAVIQGSNGAMAHMWEPKRIETLEEAIAEVLSWPWAQDPGKVDLFRAYADRDVHGLHFGLGQSVRNELGLWGKNQDLCAKVGAGEADGASSRILLAVRDHLRQAASQEDMARSRAAYEQWQAERLEKERKKRELEIAKEARSTRHNCPHCMLPCADYRKTCKFCRREVPGTSPTTEEK